MLPYVTVSSFQLQGNGTTMLEACRGYFETSTSYLLTSETCQLIHITVSSFQLQCRMHVTVILRHQVVIFLLQHYYRIKS